MYALEETLCFFSDAAWLTASDFESPRHMIALAEPRYPFSVQKMYTLFWIYGTYYTRRSELFVRISPSCASKEMIAQECVWQPPAVLSTQLEIPRRNWKILRRAESERLTHILQRFLSDAQFSRAVRYLNEFEQSYPDPDLKWELIQWTFLAMLNVWPDQPLLDVITPMCTQKEEKEESWRTLLQFCETLPSPDTGDVIDRALLIMQKEFGQDLSQSILSDRLGLEQSYFSKLFKKRCGRNFSEVLTEIRMQHAEQLLLSKPDITLDELCNACGLSSKTYFSEAFKKWKGMTITQFLKMNQK
jgi:AraC-like DNA-binding protein